MKRVLSILLTAVILLGISSASALADNIYRDSQGVAYGLSEDGTYYTVTGFNGSTAEVNIPSEINGVPVTIIGDYVFAYCYSKLTSITIPDSIITIGEYAFYMCSRLTNVTIPDSVTTVGEGAFACCYGLTSIIIGDGVITIGANAFDECYELGIITIGNSVTTIGGGAFGCGAVTSITIPDSVTTIGDGAFYGCSNLTSIDIPDSVTHIENHAFSACSSLTSITVSEDNEFYHSRENCLIETDTNTLIAGCKNSVIPDYVTTIGDSAFSCGAVTSIAIPESVTSIGDYAFSSCDGLTSVDIPDSVTTIGDYAFGNCYNLTDIYCEAASQPECWSDEWLADCNATVHWGTTAEDAANDDLLSAISTAETLIETDFNAEQWEDIQTALDFAKAYDATDKSIEDIQSVTTALNEIIAGKPLVKGDADRNGGVDQFDYLMVKRGYFDTYKLYTGDLLRADVDSSSEIDQFDYLCIKRAYFDTYTIE